MPVDTVNGLDGILGQATNLELDSVATLRCSHDRGSGGSDESGEGTKVISVDHDGSTSDHPVGELGVGYLS